MKNLSLLALMFLLVFQSCKKGFDVTYPVKGGGKDTVVSIPPTPKAWNDWCGSKVNFFGHSMVFGAGGWPLPFEFAVRYQKDTIVIGTYPNGWLDYYGQPYGGYLKHSMSFNGGVPGENPIQIYNRFKADSIDKTLPVVFWNLRNAPYVDNIRYIDSCIKLLNHDRYIVMGELQMNIPAEWKGTAVYDNIEVLNSTLAERFTKHFFNTKKFLQSKASASDSMDLVHDVTPRSMLFPGDDLHLARLGTAWCSVGIIEMLVTCK